MHRVDLLLKSGIKATVEQSIKRAFLEEYLSAHKPEVQKIMFEMYNSKYV